MSKAEVRTKVEEAIIFSKPTIETKDGVTTITYEDNDFVKNAPVTEKELKAVTSYMAKYKKAAADEAAALAEKHLKKKDAKELVVKTQYGTGARDMLETRVEKARTFTNPSTKEKVTNPYMSQKVNVSYMKNKTQLRSLSKQIAEAVK